MAEWPDTDELAQVLNIAPDANIADWQTTLDRVLAAAIQTVREDVGIAEDDYDWEPDEKVAAAALRLAELMGLRPDAVPGQFRQDPTYLLYLKGRRRVFGIA
jgi:hypothetical protein